MGKTLYLYETTVNMDYWRNYMRRDLKDKEIALLKNTRCENMMNRKIKELYGHARSKNLFVPMLTNLHGNCIFESLQYHGLCDDVDDFRKGLAMLLLAVKDKKYFFPNQEMSLSEVFATRNEIEYVFCKNKKRLYKYNFDAMCMDLATDSSWRRLDTEIILSSLTILLNIRIHTLHDNGYVTTIQTIENDDTIDIWLGLIDELHYIPLDVKVGNIKEEVCPLYREGLIEFHKWARSMAVALGRVVEEDSDDSDSGGDNSE
jgi:hypothetical protein